MEGLAKRIEEVKQSEWENSPEYLAARVSMERILTDEKNFIETASGSGELGEDDFQLFCDEKTLDKLIDENLT